MKSTYNTKINHAFVLHEADLRRVWAKLESYDCHITATVLFSDEVERTVDNIEDLVSFENSEKRKIVRINITADSSERDNRVRIEFEDYSFRTISVWASGNDELVTKVSDEMPEIISGIRPWYSFISRVDVFWLLYAPLILAYLFADMMYSSKSQKTALTFMQSAKVIGFLLLGILALFLSHKLLTHLKNYLFPVANFAIGQGVRRYQTQDQFRFAVVIGFFVSIAASLFLGLFE
ncbi:hypothetical protein [Microbulbifer sp. SAOS-129_SWC]|uniref:hypothetical protein n=1 Tax=Microbulbifer sp. SAOS-129_SWC TaxID=3145235 RepID=UPI003217637B